MTDAKIPAGWYPDPQDSSSDPRPERWWDGTGWTATTRPAGSGAAEEDTAVLDGGRVLEGEVLESDSAVRFPQPPTEAVSPAESPAESPAAGAGDGAYPLYGPPEVAPKKPSVLKRLSRPVVVAAAVAGLLGLGIGSGVTYLAVRHDDHQVRAQAAPRQKGGLPGHKRGSGGLGGGSGNGFPAFPGLPGGNGGGNGGSGNGNGGSGGSGTSDVAVDLADGISLPIPAGWQGGTVGDGSAALSTGSYDCPGAGAGSGGCSLGGVNTGSLQGTDPQAAAKADIATAVKDSYPSTNSHQEVKSAAVTVDGRSGYLVRWKVGVQQGNGGYVETVVFPAANGKSLIAVHLGFDTAPKAPDVSLMDTIVQGITDFAGSGAGTGGSATGGSST